MKELTSEGKALTRTLFLAVLFAATALAQTTPDGYPDLSGIWNIGTVTPLERPAALQDKAFFTPAEARDWEKTSTMAFDRDRRGAKGTDGDVAGAYNEAWYEPGTAVVRTLRTSVITDPPDGRIPALTPAAQKAVADRRALLQRGLRGAQDRSLAERCLYFPTAGPPMAPWVYDNNYQLIQTKDYVALYVEMIHDTRIIPISNSPISNSPISNSPISNSPISNSPISNSPISNSQNNRPHLPKDIHLWFGDSVGHYEGDTLVVDTTNFGANNPYRGSDTNLHVVERFSRMNANTLLYRFTVDDPTAFSKPWSGEYTLAADPGPVYEYACHEGNYALPNLLRGAQVNK